MARRNISELLSANLAWLIENVPELDSTPKIANRAKQLHMSASQRTVHRALTGVNEKGERYYTSSESLEAIAAAFGLDAWQLIHPDLPTMYSAQRLSPQERERVRALRQQISELSEGAQTELLDELEAAPGHART